MLQNGFGSVLELTNKAYDFLSIKQPIYLYETKEMKEMTRQVASIKIVPSDTKSNL
jgi:hypothetical protein